MSGNARRPSDRLGTSTWRTIIEPGLLDRRGVQRVTFGAGRRRLALRHQVTLLTVPALNAIFLPDRVLRTPNVDGGEARRRAPARAVRRVTS